MASLSIIGMPGWSNLALRCQAPLAPLRLREVVWGRLFFFGCGVADVAAHTPQRMGIAPFCPRSVLPDVPIHPCLLMRPQLLSRVYPLPRVMIVTGTGDTGMDRLGRCKGHAKIATFMHRPSLGLTQ